MATKKTSAPKTSSTRGYVAWIRGINVGRNNALPMKLLSTLFADAGCTDVSTYIQSGNVAFGAPLKVVKELPALIGGQIAKQLGRKVDVSVVIRSARELAGAVEHNPYPDAEKEPKSLHCGFLEAAPSAAKVALLDVGRSETDVFTVRGKELYLFTPHGYGRSKLTPAFFAKLGTPCTMRNWNTVLKLHAMLSE